MNSRAFITIENGNLKMQEILAVQDHLSISSSLCLSLCQPPHVCQIERILIQAPAVSLWLHLFISHQLLSKLENGLIGEEMDKKNSTNNTLLGYFLRTVTKYIILS